YPGGTSTRWSGGRDTPSSLTGWRSGRGGGTPTAAARRGGARAATAGRQPAGDALGGALPQGRHRVEKVLVRLGHADLVDEELHPLHGVELGERLSEEPEPLELVPLDQELFLPRPRLLDVDRREDALVHQPPVQLDLHVAGPLE